MVRGLSGWPAGLDRSMPARARLDVGWRRRDRCGEVCAARLRAWVTAGVVGGCGDLLRVGWHGVGGLAGWLAGWLGGEMESSKTLSSVLPFLSSIFHLCPVYLLFSPYPQPPSTPPHPTLLILFRHDCRSCLCSPLRRRRLGPGHGSVHVVLASSHLFMPKRRVQSEREIAPSFVPHGPSPGSNPWALSSATC